ncbi:hypothetical protein [Sandaracinus amylolyticus]|uniref:Chitin-binding type-2 domain-containing protein n=1 Tax=Sandaracinus amylolyticus TaxID=927083 RepID=A0A0F6SEP1_9BACT|nr:hypothetical protein [Sandaracinus amylolyticus]AKF05534.1 hypothetical protein DB32_002683 [Sandaracinus amylolyticus]
MTNRIVLICVLGVFGVVATACDFGVACPEGFTYNHERRVCLFTGDAGTGEPPPVDSGSPSDSGAPDSGADGGDADGGGADAGDTDAGSDAGT